MGSKVVHGSSPTVVGRRLLGVGRFAGDPELDGDADFEPENDGDPETEAEAVCDTDAGLVRTGTYSSVPTWMA
jgi:hypothetical protein